MATTQIADLPARGPHWYAIYTSANQEKKVAEQLALRTVEHFLPLYESLRHWKDRKVVLKLPLFPGYVFVRLALREKLNVLQIPGVARLVGFDGTPAALPDNEIETLRTSFESGVRAEPHPFLIVGREVLVRSGPLAGMKGILIQWKGKSRVVISIGLIQRSLSVQLEEADLAPV